MLEYDIYSRTMSRMCIPLLIFFLLLRNIILPENYLNSFSVERSKSISPEIDMCNIYTDHTPYNRTASISKIPSTYRLLIISNVHFWRAQNSSYSIVRVCRAPRKMMAEMWTNFDPHQNTSRVTSLLE